jgi:hypothetical protein
MERKASTTQYGCTMLPKGVPVQNNPSPSPARNTLPVRAIGQSIAEEESDHFILGRNICNFLQFLLWTIRRMLESTLFPHWCLQHLAAERYWIPQGQVRRRMLVWMYPQRTSLKRTKCNASLNRNTPTPERPSRMGIPINGVMFTKTDMAATWLRLVVDMYSDVQPDINEVHLPFGQKKDVYRMYRRCVSMSDKIVHNEVTQWY